MNPRPRNLVQSPARDAPRGAVARILIVGGTPQCRATFVSLLEERRHKCTHVNRLDEAQTAVANQHYDLILLNPDLPDGDGLDLAQLVLKMSPATKTIVFSDTGSFKTALRAMHNGIVDFIRLPIDLTEFADRVEAALKKSRVDRDREHQIRRLQHICKELNVAREEISDQVESLCNDLVAAYQELTEQIDDASMIAEFRTLLRQELDVEDLLRTMLEYMLVKTGPTNAAVFLPDSTRHYGLGAYVNYDCPRESIDRLLDHLCDAICPQMSDEPDIVAFDDAEEFASWIGADGGFLADSQVIAFSCMHEDECLAVVVLFRSAVTPFEPKLASTLDTIRAIFAEQLSRIIRIHHRATPQWPREADGEDDEYLDDFDYGFGGGMAA